ncbi:MAG TPA: short-chain fatty acyl-CoA regulator family protein [Sphingomonas sp.]|nr:short-chain fatty acyl-CoA regulator family protein [Sphingomonas sp.]
MAGGRPVYLGPRIRRLRRDLGLTQGTMAADLGISASYVALLESNQRPLTADLLLRIVRTYKIDVDLLAGDDGIDLVTRLQTVLKDPIFADLDVPALQDVDVATNYPVITEAFLRLHTAYREELLALADRNVGSAEAADPVADVRRFLAARRNHFPALEDTCEQLAQQVEEAGGLPRFIEARHGLRVRYMPPAAMIGMIRRHDPHNRAIFLDERLDPASRGFQLALQLLYLEARDLLTRLADEGMFTSEDSRRLGRRALAAYGAAGVVMPYRAFYAAAEEQCYDVEALARRFGASFEQVAHRLTTLQRPGEAGIPFFFVRLDAAGNVSKRLDGAGFSFARHGSGCPLWSVHDVFRRPGEILTQWLELPDGQRFFSIARLVTAGGGAFGAKRVERAVALCCSADDAGRLVYTQGRPSDPATPIGISCALCHREACTARAIPPLGRALLPDDYHRRQAPFGFGDK